MNPQEALEAWARITMLIENDWGEKGTGFLVKPAINVNGSSYIKFFLVSCKHVLNRDAKLREQAEEITIYPLVRQSSGSMQREPISLNLRYEDGSQVWRGHPDPDVDVIVFDVTDLIINDMRTEHGAPGLEVFVSGEWIKRLGITTNDAVTTIGFPDMGRSETSDPVFRSGTISTSLGKRIEFQNEKGGCALRAFVVDGEAIPGSSGSPVLLKPTVGRVISGRNYFGMSVPPVLLGVLAETTYAKVEYESFSGWTYSRMGIAFDADTILDTIKLYVG